MQEDVRRNFKDDNSCRQQTIADINLVRCHFEVFRDRVRQRIGDIAAIALESEECEAQNREQNKIDPTRLAVSYASMYII